PAAFSLCNHGLPQSAAKPPPADLAALIVRCHPAAAPCLQCEPVVSRTIKVKPLWPHQGRGKVVQSVCGGRLSQQNTGLFTACTCDDECIAAVLDLWFGGTGIPLSRRSLPGTSRRGTKLAKAGGVTPWRFASKAGFRPSPTPRPRSAPGSREE